MKNPIWSGLIVAMLLLGCSHKDAGKKEQPDQVQPTPTETEELLDNTEPTCYLFATDRDTVSLRLYPPVEGKIKGDLNYYFFERDGNTGHIEGEIHGDTLFADYTFQSEGLISVREVAFLLGEGQVMEGYGDVEEKDGRMVFWHKDSLDFSNGLVMPKVPCSSLY